MRALARLLPLLLLAACVHRPEYQPVQSPVIDAMARRLALSQEVAWAKYADGQPVRDPAREAEIVRYMASLAGARGMDIPQIRTVFTAQIAASCAEQESLIKGWKRGAPGPGSAPRDIAAIRRDIDATNLALLDALDRTSDLRSLKIPAEMTLKRYGFSAEAVEIAVKPF